MMMLGRYALCEVLEKTNCSDMGIGNVTASPLRHPPKNDPDVNKEEEQSPSVHRTFGGRLVRICQPGAHSQEIVPLFTSLSYIGQGMIIQTIV
jgi:hypothetical protein